MDAPSEKTWALKDGANNDVFATLSSVLNTSVNAPITSTLVFLDDFDSHLWKANYLFYKTEDQQFKLLDPAGKVNDLSGPTNARFAWDFTDGAEALRTLIGKRALTPFASLHLVEQHFSLCNEDQKIVVKACVTQVILESTTVSYLTVRPLRGYHKYFTRTVKAIDSLLIKNITDFGFRYLIANYAAPFFRKRDNLSIDADTPTEDAVRTMASFLLGEAGLHVAGAINDVDTEFLRKFRVNLRRARSLVSLLKKSLPQLTGEALKHKLSLIARKTNRLRDLDVFLLDENKYRELLPKEFAGGLAELYTIIRAQRAQEQKILAMYFESDAYTGAIATCSEALALTSVYEIPLAKKPILKVAKKLLLNRYDKMLAMGRDIDSQSDDESIHALRIELKKFRYLTEFFIDLLPKEDITNLMGEMKAIQTVLGDFNDYATQIAFLKNYIDDERIEMSKSLCGLIAVLHQKQADEKRKVNATLEGFFTEAMTHKLGILFSSTTQGSAE